MGNLYDIGRDCELLIEDLPKIGLLEGLGLRVGTRVAVRQRYGLGGPVLLRVEDAFSVAIGKDIASRIVVKKLAAS
ncbi:MAG: ferrous iron transport protein A [Defluviitaleaceae bacterium]|nr:ferrous iron transport protein A [Defluviitaleaceae bacterium]